MPFQKGLQNYNIFSIYANFHVDYLTFFAEKAIFTPIYLHMCEKTTTFAIGFDNCTLQNNTINPIFI